MAEEARILDLIDSPADLKLLSNEELEILACEIREQIVTTTSLNGGHVASSLGAVEIILALHSLMDCPNDRIVYDVGHQAYAHKLITGRRDSFSSLRQLGGISGFPKPSESIYDAHPSGHASDSLSVALGLAKARDLRGSNEKVVALIGDAALAGGMAFEALNQIGQDQTPMVIVLNDNQMSISHNVGALMRHLGYLRTSQTYRHTRDSLQELMENSGGIISGLLDLGRNAKESVKQFIIPNSMMFESLGITCTAPVDGHNIAHLREVFNRVLNAQAPVLVHVVTKKGIGYEPARSNPEMFHGVGPYDIKTGQVKKGPLSHPKYTKVFSDALIDEANKDEDIVAITAAMTDGTGLAAFAEAHPTRFFDVGIAEEHALGLASGLAFGGKKPVVAIYSTFMQRAFDQIIIDNALPSLNVVFCIDRAGLVGDDGPTHNGMFDISFMRMIPHMRVMTPSNEAELVHALHTALAIGGPVSIRYPRGQAEGVPLPTAPKVLQVGKGDRLREGEDVAVLAWGRMAGCALEAAGILAKQGIEARVVDMRWAKPIDKDAVCNAAKTKLIVTVEEGVIPGGAGEGVLQVMASQGVSCPTVNLGLPDDFIEVGKVPELFAKLGLDAQGIVNTVLTHLNR